MKTKLMSLGSIIIHVVVCCCLLAATTGCSNSKDSANAQATQHKAVRNKLSSGAKTLLTVGGTQSAPSGGENTFEEDSGSDSDSGTQGERKDTKQDKGKEALVRLVKGLEDQDAENVYKQIVNKKKSFPQKLALAMGFQGKKDKDAAGNLRKVLDDVTNKNIAKKRKIIEVIVSTMYEESPGFKKKIDNLIRYVCNVTSEGEVMVCTHKKGHKVQEKTWRKTQINGNIEKGTSKERGEKVKNSYKDLSSKEFGTHLPCILKCEEAKNKTVSAVESVLNRWIQDHKWQKRERKDDKQYFESYNKGDEVEGKKYTKETPYTNLNQVIKDLNSHVN